MGRHIGSVQHKYSVRAHYIEQICYKENSSNSLEQYFPND